MNKHLLHDLTEMGLWSPAIKNNIIYENGSVHNIAEIPDELKVIYKYGTATFLHVIIQIYWLGFLVLLLFLVLIESF